MQIDFNTSKIWNPDQNTESSSRFEVSVDSAGYHSPGFQVSVQNTATMHVLQCHCQLHYPVHHHLLIKTLPFLLVLRDLPIKVTPLQGHPKQKSVLQFLHDLKTHPFLVLCYLPTKVTPLQQGHPKHESVLPFLHDLKTHPLFVLSNLPTKSPPCKVTQNRNQCYSLYMTSKPIPFLYSVMSPSSLNATRHRTTHAPCMVL